MSQESIEQSVVEVICESLALDLDEVKTNTLIIKELNADSLDIIDIMFLLEERFEVTLEKEDFNFLTKISLDQEAAVTGDGFLVPQAKKELREWLPSLDLAAELKPSDLREFLSVQSVVNLVQQKGNS
jgi:acyl carrier protein